MLAKELASVRDNELVKSCQQGDREAFRLLYRRYQKRVRATLYQLCGTQMLDDLVQEVFLRVWRGLPKLRDISTFSTWLYRISWNVATDRRRQLALNRERLATLPDEQRLAASDPPGLMALHYQELVRRGLDNLSLDHRAVIVLHDLEDLPQKQIAKILEVPVGTVKSRLFHARRSLRQYLETQGVTP